MPHVIIRNPPDLAEYYRAFVPWETRHDDGRLIEARAAYLRHDKLAVLVETKCLELGPPQSFFVLAEHKKQQITVRCHVFPSPERTPLVKEAVARVARDILALGGQVERTNLEL